MASAISKLEASELPHILTEPFIMHRVRARLLQAYFSSVASEVYLPDLVALPPVSLRRRLLVNLIQKLPNSATIFQDAAFLLELVPFASLADALQLPSKEATARLRSIHKNLCRDVQSIPPSKALLGCITSQTLVDVVTENFPFHSKAARLLLSFKGVGEHANCSITQTLASMPNEEWPAILIGAGVAEAESRDRISQVELLCNAYAALPPQRCVTVIGCGAYLNDVTSFLRQPILSLSFQSHTAMRVISVAWWSALQRAKLDATTANTPSTVARTRRFASAAPMLTACDAAPMPVFALWSFGGRTSRRRDVDQSAKKRTLRTDRV